MSGGALILVIAMLALVWLLLIRPSKRRQVEQSSMIEAIEPGDEVLTAGGIYGYVKTVDGDELTVEIAPELTIRLARRAVAAVIPPESEQEPAELSPAHSDGTTAS